MADYEMQREQVLVRRASVEGQVRGMARMVQEDRYCIEVLNRVAAVKGALEHVAIGLVHDHLGDCVVGAVKAGGDPAADKIDEATAAIARRVRS